METETLDSLSIKGYAIKKATILPIEPTNDKTPVNENKVPAKIPDIIDFNIIIDIKGKISILSIINKIGMYAKPILRKKNGLGRIDSIKLKIAERLAKNNI